MQPSIVACTPRFWTMLYNQYQKQLLAATLRARERRQIQLGEGRTKPTGEAKAAVHTNTASSQQGDSVKEEVVTKVEAMESSSAPEEAVGPTRAHHETALSASSPMLENPTASVLSPGTVSGFSPGGPLADHLSSERSEEQEHKRLTKGLQRQFSEAESPELMTGNAMSEVDDEAIRKSVQKHFSKVLGGRICVLVTGGAATGKAVIKFMQSTFNCMVSDGYGATEVRLSRNFSHRHP